MKRLVAAIAACALLGCASPMIPLPPPALDDIAVGTAPGLDGWLVMRGENAPAGVRVVVINVTQDVGVLARAGTDGRWETIPFPGEFGDRVTVEYEDEGRALGEPLCLEVAEGRQSALDECPRR